MKKKNDNFSKNKRVKIEPAFAAETSAMLLSTGKLDVLYSRVKCDPGDRRLSTVFRCGERLFEREKHNSSASLVRRP